MISTTVLLINSNYSNNQNNKFRLRFLFMSENVYVIGCICWAINYISMYTNSYNLQRYIRVVYSCIQLYNSNAPRFFVLTLQIFSYLFKIYECFGQSTWGYKDKQSISRCRKVILYFFVRFKTG